MSEDREVEYRCLPIEEMEILMRWICLLGFIFLYQLIYGQERSIDLQSNNYFHAGEFLKYKVIYKYKEAWVTAGKVTFELSERGVNGKRHIVCLAKGNTAPAFDLFYKVRDEYATILEPETLLPKYFLRRVSEGGFKIYNDYDFRQDSLRLIAETQDTKNPHRIDTFSIVKNTQDLVSAILYCRSLDYSRLDSGDSYQFPIFIDRNIYQVGIKYMGKTTITTDEGEYKCILLQPKLLTGRIFKEEDQMKIYMTDDERRLVVYVESPLLIGKVAAVLTEYKQ